MPFHPTVVFISLPRSLTAASLRSLPFGRSSHGHIPIGRLFSFQRSREKLPLTCSDWEGSKLTPCGKIFQNVLSLIWTKGIEMDTHFCGCEKSPSTCSDRERPIFNRFLKKLFFVWSNAAFPTPLLRLREKVLSLVPTGRGHFPTLLAKKFFASH